MPLFVKLKELFKHKRSLDLNVLCVTTASNKGARSIYIILVPGDKRAAHLREFLHPGI